MPDPGLTRVAVYIDFDNIVISRYEQVHGRSQFQRDRVRDFDRDESRRGGRLCDGALRTEQARIPLPRHGACRDAKHYHADN